MSAPILNVKKLTIIFRQRGKPFVAVDHVNFQIKPGEIFGLVGESGSGKTTTGRAVLNLLPSAYGSIELNGRALPANPNFVRKETSEWLAKTVQMIFQDPFGSLNPSKQVFNIIAEGLLNFNPVIAKKERFNRLYKIKKAYYRPVKGAPGKQTDELISLIGDIYKLKAKIYELKKVTIPDYKNQIHDLKTHKRHVAHGANVQHRLIGMEEERLLEKAKKEYDNNLTQAYDLQKKQQIIDTFEQRFAREIKPIIEKRRALRAKLVERKAKLNTQRLAAFEELRILKEALRNHSLPELAKKYEQINHLDQSLTRHDLNKAEKKATQQKRKTVYNSVVDQEYKLLSHQETKVRKIIEQYKHLERQHQLPIKRLSYKINRLRRQWKHDRKQALNNQALDPQKKAIITTDYYSQVMALKAEFQTKKNNDSTKIPEIVAKAKQRYEEQITVIENKIAKCTLQIYDQTKAITKAEAKLNSLVETINKNHRNREQVNKILVAYKEAKSKAVIEAKANLQKALNNLTFSLPPLSLEEKKQMTAKEIHKRNQSLRRETEINLKVEKENIIFKHDQDFSQKLEDLADQYVAQMNPLDPGLAFKLKAEVVKKQRYSRHAIQQHLINRVYDVLQQVGLSPAHAWRYPAEFSGGQRQRIGIARALVMEPSLMVADEPISALDVSIQAQIINLLKDLRDKNKLSILLIAHDLRMVTYICDRIAVVTKGKMVEIGPAEEIFYRPCHPYTRSLMASVPSIDQVGEAIKIIPYDFSDHNYDELRVVPTWHEIKPGHLVLGTDQEVETWIKKTAVKRHD